MSIKTRNATLIAALAAVGATAWAANELIEPVDPAKDPIMALALASEASQASMPPATPAPEPTDPAPPPSEPGLSPGPAALTAPVASQPEAVAQPPVIVEDRRMSLDERIQAQVIDRLAASEVSGRIGVESNDAVVTLTGTVFSGSHVDRAGRYAREVQDVKYVQNELRSQLSRW